MTAWFEWVCRIIPSEKMTSSWAGRWLIQGIGGLLAGGVIAVVLQQIPGPRGYGVLMLLTFACLVVSFFFLMAMKEVVPPIARERGQRVSLLGSWGNLCRIWQEDGIFRRYLYARMLAFAYLLPAPFLGLQAMAVTGGEEAFLGLLVVVQMAGGILANGGSAWLGDRLGPRWLLLASRMTLIAACAGIWVAGGRMAWCVIFFLYGFSFATQQVGFSAMLAQICPPGRRPSFIALQGVVTIPCLLSAAWLAGWLIEKGGGLTTIAGLTILLEVWAGWLLWRMPKRGRSG